MDRNVQAWASVGYVHSTTRTMASCASNSWLSSCPPNPGSSSACWCTRSSARWVQIWKWGGRGRQRDMDKEQPLRGFLMSGHGISSIPHRNARLCYPGPSSWECQQGMTLEGPTWSPLPSAVPSLVTSALSFCSGKDCPSVTSVTSPPISSHLGQGKIGR